MIASIIGVVYLLFNEFSVPKQLKEKVTQLTKSYYGLDFDYDYFSINIPSNKVSVSSFSLSVADKSPFVSIGSTTVELASSTEVIGMINDKIVVNKIVINDLKYDMLAPQLEEASGAFKLPSVPAKEIIVNGFSINTLYGNFDLSSNTVIIKKDGSIVDAILDIPNGPFGISSNLVFKANLDNGSSTIDVKIKHNSIADCLPLSVFASEKNIRIDDGSFDLNISYNGNIEKRINEPAKDWVNLLNNELQGNISIKNTKIGWNGLTYEGSVNLNKIASQSWMCSLNGKFASGTLDIKGKWLGDENQLSKFETDFNLNQIKFTKANLSNFGLTDFGYKPGSISVSGQVKGDIASFSGSGKALAGNWYFLDKKLEKADLDWNLSEDLTIKTGGYVDTYLGHLKASSTIWLTGPNKYKGVVEGSLKDVGLKQIGTMVDVPLDGMCSGPFVIEIDFLEPLKSIYSFKASLENGSFYTFNSKHIDALISGSGTDWKLINPHAMLKDGGEIWVEGFISSSTLDTKVKIKDTNLVNFGLTQEIASGCANLEATARGPLLKPEVKGTLWGDNIVVMNMPLKSLKSEVRIKDSVLRLVPIVVKPIDGSFIDGYITIDLADGKIINAGVNFQQFCLELLRPYLPLKISSKELDGVFSGYANYSRRQDNNYFKVLVDGRDLLIAGEEIDSVYLEGESLGKQADLKSLFIRAFGGKVNLTGQFKNLQKFSGSIEGENLKFDRMEFLKSFLPSITGSLDFQGNIDWDDKNRNGHFIVFGRNIMTDERELGNYGGEVVINNEKLEIKNGEFDKLGIKLSGDLKWGGRQPYNFKLDLNKVDFSFIPQSHDFTLFENGSILVNGNCVVQGDLASLTPNLVDLKFDNIQIKKDDDVIVTNKPIHIKCQNGNVDIQSFELKYKLGILSVSGLISAAKNVGINIKGDNFSAKALGHLFGLKNINYDGAVSLNGKVYGTTDDIKYSYQTEINNFTIEGKEIPLVQAKIEGDSRLLKIEETFVKLKNNSFDLKGTISLDNFVPNNLDLKISIPNGPISDLSVYLPKVIKEAEGLIKGELNITGSPSNPEIIGDLHLNGKKIQLTSMKKPFTNVEFDMTTDDKITTVNTLKASMGKGIIEGYGKVDFKNALGALDVHLRTEKLDLPFMSLEIFNASAAVDLTGDIYNPVIFSNIYIPRGRLGLNMNLIPESSKSEPIFNSLKYRVNVEIPRNFWVKNAFLNAEMKGKCSVSGDLENFKVEGGISTIQGKIFFKQRQFKIQNGEIRFGGVDNSLDPYIFVKSEGQVQSTKIYLTLTGNISNFKPQVYSTPPMSEGDIIAMLTLGRDLNAVSNSDTKDLFEDEVLEGLKNSYISALIGNQLSSALNLDELYLTSAFDKKTGKTQSYVRIGKYLSDKVFMAYEGNMSDDRDESYIFEYRLPKGFIFSIEFEQPENNQNYGIRYDWKF